MQPKIERILAWCALACWLASWFLPVLDDYTGWAAFLAALEGPFRDPSPTRGEDAIAQFLSALTNLLDNAVKYSEPPSAVELNATAQDGMVTIMVTDHGLAGNSRIG